MIDDVRYCVISSIGSKKDIDKDFSKISKKILRR